MSKNDVGQALVESYKQLDKEWYKNMVQEFPYNVDYSIDDYEKFIK